jgi:hypothetical protein
MKKFDDRWFGPFRVQKVLSRNAYRLTLPHNFRRIHPVFHVSLLRRWHSDPITERPQPSQPEPVLADSGDPEYEVEAILNSRMHYRKLQYLVHWKGYGPEHNSWEPADNLANLAPLVAYQLPQSSPSCSVAMKPLPKPHRQLNIGRMDLLVGSPSHRGGVMSEYTPFYILSAIIVGP